MECVGEIRVDQGPAFIAGSFKACCEKYRVAVEYSPAYVPELMGWIEEINRVVRYGLAKECGEDYSKWDIYLPGIFRGIRCKVNARSGFSPYYLLFGIDPIFPEVEEVLLVEQSLDARLLEIGSIPGVRAGIIREARSSSSKLVFKMGVVVKVLKAKLRKRSVLGKTKYRWSSPFIIVGCY
jgi:hypothetical protein